MGEPTTYKLDTVIGSNDLTEKLKQGQQVTEDLFNSQALRYDTWKNEFYLLGYFGSSNRKECEYRFRKINMGMSLEKPDPALEKILEQEREAGLEPCSFDITRDDIVVAERNKEQDEKGSLSFYNKEDGTLKNRVSLEHEGYNRIINTLNLFFAAYGDRLDHIAKLDINGKVLDTCYNRVLSARTNFAADRKGDFILLGSSAAGYRSMKGHTFKEIETSADSLLLDGLFYNISSEKGFRAYTSKGKLLHASDIPETEYIERTASIDSIMRSENHGHIALVYNGIVKEDKDNRKRVHTKIKLVRVIENQQGTPE